MEFKRCAVIVTSGVILGILSVALSQGFGPDGNGGVRCFGDGSGFTNLVNASQELNCLVTQGSLQSTPRYYSPVGTYVALQGAVFGQNEMILKHNCYLSNLVFSITNLNNLAIGSGTNSTIRVFTNTLGGVAGWTGQFVTLSGGAATFLIGNDLVDAPTVLAAPASPIFMTLQQSNSVTTTITYECNVSMDLVRINSN